MMTTDFPWETLKVWFSQEFRDELIKKYLQLDWSSAFFVKEKWIDHYISCDKHVVTEKSVK